MSNVKEAEAPGTPSDSGTTGAPSGAPAGASSGASRGSTALTGEDLSTAYNLGLRNNNELTQQLLLDQVKP